MSMANGWIVLTAEYVIYKKKSFGSLSLNFTTHKDWVQRALVICWVSKDSPATSFRELGIKTIFGLNAYQQEFPPSTSHSIFKTKFIIYYYLLFIRIFDTKPYFYISYQSTQMILWFKSIWLKYRYYNNNYSLQNGIYHATLHNE